MIGGYEILVQGFLRCDITVVEIIGRFNDCVCWVRGHAFDCGSLGSIVVCEKHSCTSRESLRDGIIENLKQMSVRDQAREDI